MIERPTFSQADYDRFRQHPELATVWQANLTAVITRSGLSFEGFEQYIVGKSKDMMLGNPEFATDGTLRCAEINLSNILECARTERVMKAHGFAANNGLGDNTDIGIDPDAYRKALSDDALNDDLTPGIITPQEQNHIETKIPNLQRDYDLYCMARGADADFISIQN